MAQLKEYLSVCLILLASFGIIVGFAAISTSDDQVMTLTNLRQMLGDRTKFTSYQKYLIVLHLLLVIYPLLILIIVLLLVQ